MERSIIEAINKQPHKVFITATGGGQNFIGDYLSVEGGSATILGFYVPYKQELFDEFAGKPDNYASEEAARKLAVASYKKAVGPYCIKEFAIGIGAASSVASANEREGRKHRLNVAVQTMTQTRTQSYVLNQGRTREEENRIVENMILELLADACGVPCSLPSVKIDVRGGESYTANIVNASPEQIELVHGERTIIPPKLVPERIALYCGSFNPIHEAHAAIADLVKKQIGYNPFFEISVKNTDKGFIDYSDMLGRYCGIRNKGFDVIFTAAPRYVDKIKAFKSVGAKGITFVVGQDTWIRIWDEKYGVKIGELVDTFYANDIRFIVVPREGAGEIPECSDKWHINALDIAGPEIKAFKMNMSSSEIRRKHAHS